MLSFMITLWPPFWRLTCWYIRLKKLHVYKENVLQDTSFQGFFQTLLTWTIPAPIRPAPRTATLLKIKKKLVSEATVNNTELIYMDSLKWTCILWFSDLHLLTKWKIKLALFPSLVDHFLPWKISYWEISNHIRRWEGGAHRNETWTKKLSLEQTKTSFT